MGEKDAIEERPAPPATDVTRASLVAELESIEALTRYDHDAAYDRAVLVFDAARALPDIGLRLRAELAKADAMYRRGQLTAAGRTARTVGRWADRSGDRYLQARSHLVLAGFSLALGDAARALEHAVLSVQLLDGSAPPRAHIDHQLRLATVMAITGDVAGARPRYAEVISQAERLGDVPLLEVALNNLACAEHQVGEHARAAELLERVQGLVRDRGGQLHPGMVDTLARVLLALDRAAEAEEMLLAIDPIGGMADVAVTGRAQCLLLLAEVQRRRGALDRAQQSIDLCVRLSETAGLAKVRAGAHGEQSEIYAAAGRYAEAYTEHRRFHEQTTALQSAENVSRARTVQAVFEATEARQEARRYREMALRDPLTGLHNRRFVEDELPRLLRFGSISGLAPAPITVALVDLDHFKAVNDTCSHEIGDQVLRIVAQILKEQMAANGADAIAARVGGEEFLLVLPSMSESAAAAALEDVRVAVAGRQWRPLTGDLLVTVSIGATRVQPHDVGVLPGVLLARADRHLYAAKRAGRNCVVTDPQTDRPMTVALLPPAPGGAPSTAST